MSDDIPLPPAAERSRYAIHDRREVAALLRDLRDRRSLITVAPADGDAMFTTVILEVDERHDRVVLDCASAAAANRRLLECGRVRCHTALDRVRILFESRIVDDGGHDGAPALRIALPVPLIRLQRRDHFRVATPRTDSATATLRAQFAPEGSEVTLPLVDIGGGGISVSDEDDRLDRTVGVVYPAARIDLPDGASFIASLQVRNARPVRLADGRTQQQIGLAFYGLTSEIEMAIQRYVIRLQRERLARGVKQP